MKDKTPAAFFERLAALMDEFKVSDIDVVEVTRGYDTWADGIEFGFDGIYSDDHDVIRPWSSAKLSTNITSADLREEALALATDLQERPCSACSGSGHYDSTGSPPCGSCTGSGTELYDAAK